MISLKELMLAVLDSWVDYEDPLSRYPLISCRHCKAEPKIVKEKDFQHKPDCLIAGLLAGEKAVGMRFRLSKADKVTDDVVFCPGDSLRFVFHPDSPTEVSAVAIDPLEV